MENTGSVVFFDVARGYGFIKPDDGVRDVFVHATALAHVGLRSLNGGQRVKFNVDFDKVKGQGKVTSLSLL